MIQLDYRNSQAIYEQIADGLENLMAIGDLSPGQQLPSVRVLAAELSVNPNTVQKAYKELEKRGSIHAVKGRGCFISSSSHAAKKKKLDKIEKEISQIFDKARDMGADKWDILALLCRLAEQEERKK